MYSSDPNDYREIPQGWDEIFEFQSKKDGGNYSMLKEWLKKHYDAPSLLIDKDGFQQWMDDGNVEKIADNVYIEQTTQWRVKFTLDELKQFYIKEFLN